jgi:hypothetical protein
MPELAFAELPPGLFSFSTRVTTAPCDAASSAADRPARPVPTTITRRAGAADEDEDELEEEVEATV